MALKTPPRISAKTLCVTSLSGLSEAGLSWEVLPLWCALPSRWPSLHLCGPDSTLEEALGPALQCARSSMKETHLPLGLLGCLSFAVTALSFSGLRILTPLGCGVNVLGFGCLIDWIFTCSEQTFAAGEPAGERGPGSLLTTAASPLSVSASATTLICSLGAPLPLGSFGLKLLSLTPMDLLTLLPARLRLLAVGFLLASSLTLLAAPRLPAVELARPASRDLINHGTVWNWSRFSRLVPANASWNACGTSLLGCVRKASPGTSISSCTALMSFADWFVPTEKSSSIPEPRRALMFISSPVCQKSALSCAVNSPLPGIWPGDGSSVSPEVTESPSLWPCTGPSWLSEHSLGGTDGQASSSLVFLARVVHPNPCSPPDGVCFCLKICYWTMLTPTGPGFMFPNPRMLADEVRLPSTLGSLDRGKSALSMAFLESSLPTTSCTLSATRRFDPGGFGSRTSFAFPLLFGGPLEVSEPEAPFSLTLTGLRSRTYFGICESGADKPWSITCRKLLDFHPLQTSLLMFDVPLLRGLGCILLRLLCLLILGEPTFLDFFVGGLLA